YDGHRLHVRLRRSPGGRRLVYINPIETDVQLDAVFSVFLRQGIEGSGQSPVIDVGIVNGRRAMRGRGIEQGEFAHDGQGLLLREGAVGQFDDDDAVFVHAQQGKGRDRFGQARAAEVSGTQGNR